jgi:hypothetical protein
MNSIRKAPETFIVVNHDGMGQAEEPLRMKLIGTYLRLLEENQMLPGAMGFYGAGVKLVVDGSPVLEQLRRLESLGAHLIISQTCLNFYGLVDQVRVGIIGGMPDILSAQWAAAKVITL